MFRYLNAEKNYVKIKGMEKERIFLHDISSPLTAIHLNIGSAVSLLEESGNADKEECLRILKNSLEQAKKLAQMIAARREILIKAGL